MCTPGVMAYVGEIRALLLQLPRASREQGSRPLFVTALTLFARTVRNRFYRQATQLTRTMLLRRELGG